MTKQTREDINKEKTRIMKRPAFAQLVKFLTKTGYIKNRIFPGGKSPEEQVFNALVEYHQDEYNKAVRLGVVLTQMAKDAESATIIKENAFMQDSSFLGSEKLIALTEIMSSGRINKNAAVTTIKGQMSGLGPPGEKAGKAQEDETEESTYGDTQEFAAHLVTGMQSSSGNEIFNQQDLAKLDPITRGSINRLKNIANSGSNDVNKKIKETLLSMVNEKLKTYSFRFAGEENVRELNENEIETITNNLFEIYLKKEQNPLFKYGQLEVIAEKLSALELPDTIQKETNYGLRAHSTSVTSFLKNQIGSITTDNSANKVMDIAIAADRKSSGWGKWILGQLLRLCRKDTLRNIIEKNMPEIKGVNKEDAMKVVDALNKRGYRYSEIVSAVICDQKSAIDILKNMVTEMSKSQNTMQNIVQVADETSENSPKRSP